MNQIIGLLDSYAYRAMVWDVYVERIDKPNEGKVSDEALISAGLEKSRTCLGTLARLKAPGDWLLGDQLTLADLHAAPMFGYFVKRPRAAPCSRTIPSWRVGTTVPAAEFAAGRRRVERLMAMTPAFRSATPSPSPASSGSITPANSARSASIPRRSWWPIWLCPDSCQR